MYKIVESLSNQIEQIHNKLDKLSSQLPEGTSKVSLFVFVDQDGEGFITVRASLSGKDQYVLNKEVKEVAELFDEYIPDPEGSVYKSDFIVDSVIDFLAKNISSDCLSRFPVDVTILNPEGYGNHKPIKLT